MKSKKTNDCEVFIYEEANGRQYVIIGGEKAYVDLLVAETFLVNPDPKVYTEVEHINGDMSDNAAANLRWTRGGNDSGNRQN